MENEQVPVLSSYSDDLRIQIWLSVRLFSEQFENEKRQPVPRKLFVQQDGFKK